MESPEETGLLVDDVRFTSPAPQRVVSAVPVEDTLPVLVGRESSPLARLAIEVDGDLDPIAMRTLRVGRRPPEPLVRDEEDAAGVSVGACGEEAAPLERLVRKQLVEPQECDDRDEMHGVELGAARCAGCSRLALPPMQAVEQAWRLCIGA